MSNKCLYCYHPLSGGEVDFHAKCAKKMFGSTQVSVLDYSLDQMQELAHKVVQSHVTVPGVQAKLSFCFEPKRGEANRLTLVGVLGNFILKPPTNQFANFPENEDLTMHLASLFKIETVPHSLIRLKSGELAYITKRIDRVKGAKLPMEDLCQLSERLTEDKYKGSMEQIGKVIMQYSSNPFFLEPNHVQQIYSWYTSYEDVENRVKVASLDDIKENDYNLNIPLYVEKIIEDNLPSVEEALTDLKEAWDESLKAEEKFKTILKEFI